MGIIKTNEPVLPEGVFLNKWIYNRMVAKNKNIIGVTTGATGSGKSYVDMRIYENWCKRMKFTPSITYICFSISEVMKLLTSESIPKYSLIIFEEAGTSLGNLDFQNRVSKLFTYILQSFRSMNIGLIMNLPVFTMLNKSARQLVHFHLITEAIDYEEKKVRVKCYFHQLNQSSGKSYWKLPRIEKQGRIIRLDYLKFNLPSSELIKQYENKKQKFVMDLANDFVEELNKIERDKTLKLERKDLTPLQNEVFRMVKLGKTQQQIADLKQISQQMVSQVVKAIKNKGYSLENVGLQGSKSPRTPI